MFQDFIDVLKPTKKSGEWSMAKCPAHEDKKESLAIKVNAEGVVGIKCHAGCITDEVVEACGLKMSDLFPPKSATAAKKNDFGNIIDTYWYHDKDGNELYQVVRTDTKKFPVRHKKDGNWVWGQGGITRVLFHLPNVIAATKASPPKTIILVEGEKDVISLEKLGFTATTNPGGAEKWNKSYNTILNKTTVVLLPDNDKAGRLHTAKIRKNLKDLIVVELPGMAEHGDVSDWIEQGGTKPALMDLIRTAHDERETEPAPPPPLYTTATIKTPFVAIGHQENGSALFFMSNRTGQVIKLSPGTTRSIGHLLMLAPLVYWESKYEQKTGFDIDMAQDDITTQAINAGLYDPNKQRGRGAWMDAGRTVWHSGEHLVVDGERMPVLDNKFKTGYVYTLCQPYNMPKAAPLSSDQSMKLIELFQRLPFENELGVIMLAGWTALAPICGVLDWRPHAWLTGGSGSGKSWILDNIINTMIGATALYVLGTTSEAGLRQKIGHDAPPIFFDESEMEDAQSQMKMQKVLELARAASSSSGGAIVKGSADGTPQEYIIKSMFLMSSVTVGIHKRADETRVTVIQLRNPTSSSAEATSKFTDTQDMALKLCTPEYAAGMVARMVKLAPIIKKNAATFSIAVACTIASKRCGDQLGTLIAGNWALQSDDEIDLERASEYVDGLDLESMIPDESNTDETRCYSFIMEQSIDVETGKGRVKRTIGELVEASYFPVHNDIDTAVAHGTLCRHGLKCADEGLLVSTNHSALAAMLSGTPWAHGWCNVLKRYKSATTYPKVVRFPGNIVSKAVVIPWSEIKQDFDQELIDAVDAITPDAETGELL